MPFINISAPSVVSGMSGESEKTLRDTFEEAKVSHYLFIPFSTVTYYVDRESHLVYCLLTKLMLLLRNEKVLNVKWNVE